MENEDYKYVCKCDRSICYAGDINKPDTGTPEYCCITGEKDAHWKKNIE